MKQRASERGGMCTHSDNGTSNNGSASSSSTNRKEGECTQNKGPVRGGVCTCSSSGIKCMSNRTDVGESGCTNKRCQGKQGQMRSNKLGSTSDRASADDK